MLDMSFIFGVTVRYVFSTAKKSSTKKKSINFLKLYKCIHTCSTGKSSTVTIKALKCCEEKLGLVSSIKQIKQKKKTQ